MSTRPALYAMVLAGLISMSVTHAGETVPPNESAAIAPIFSYSHSDRVDLLAISPDGVLLATESLDGIRISTLRTGALLRTWPEHGFHANSMAFSYNGKILGTGNNDGQVRLWNTQTGALLKQLPICRWSIYAIAFSPDGKTLASCAGDGTVQLWDIASDEYILTVGKRGERMCSMAFSPDGRSLATLSRYARADVWEVHSGRLINTLGGRGVDMLCSVSFCPQGAGITVACYGDVYLWDPLAEGKAKKIRIPDSIDPEQHQPTDAQGSPVSRLIFIGRTVLSSDCHQAATVNLDGSISVWDTATRQVQHTLMGSRVGDLAGGGVEAMVFSPDARLLASANRNGKVQAWRIAPEP